jgi:hypothetical protein
MSWVAVAIGGSAIIGGVASNNSANKQVKAANRAGDLQMQIYNQTREDTGPYREAGYAATHKLQSLLGILNAPSAPNRDSFAIHSGQGAGKFDPHDPLGLAKGRVSGHKSPGQKDGFDEEGYNNAMAQYQTDLGKYNEEIKSSEYGSLMHQFNADDLKNGLSPNYDFMLGQGQGATNALANREEGLVSDNALKGINDYTQNYAGNAYQQAFSNYTANQTNIFNRLSAIAGFGQSANQITGPAGVASGQNIGNSYMAAGQAGASGIVGASNAVSNGASNLGSWYGMKNLLNSNQNSGQDYNGIPTDAGLEGAIG